MHRIVRSVPPVAHRLARGAAFALVLAAGATLVSTQSLLTTEQLDVTNNGTSANAGPAVDFSISPDGRFIAFASQASNLPADGHPYFEDVFVRDRGADVTDLISVNSAGAPSNGISIDPAISADGRVVAFTSDATNLVPNDTNQCDTTLFEESFVPGDCPDIFVRDRLTGTTERISVSSAGAQGDYRSYGAQISADGRFVLFGSQASNLVAGDGIPLSADLFIHDRQTHGTSRVINPASIGAYAIQAGTGAVMTPDAAVVAFSALGTQYGSQIFVLDRRTGAAELVSVSRTGGNSNGFNDTPAISADGRFVAWSSRASNLVAGDTNGKRDVFVRDRVTRTTERVNVSDSGTQANGDSPADMFFGPVGISGDGRFVAFGSIATNLVPGDTNTCTLRDRYAFLAAGQCPDVFVRDRLTRTTARVSLSDTGAQANDVSWRPAMSANGRVTAFLSIATNLVAGGTTNPCVGSRGAFPLNSCAHLFARVATP